ncbi:MAG: DUF4125 family protein [Lachnospiraceae bacterium]|nr:DUF4125 family protein [Lachnospiraceae bacterium]
MDINRVTSELDRLFAQEKIDEIPQFLESHIAQAMEEGAQDIVLTLYNETIGFYRETGQYERSLENCQKATALLDEMGIQDTIPYATTLLNVANAYRAAGRLQESLAFYNKVRPVYVALLDEDDMYFASFYNNLSLLYQEMGDFAAAKEQLVNALFIVNHKEDKQFEVAVTQANLANTCIELEQDDEAKARAEEAIRIFEEIGVDDAHYSAALSALGSLYYMDKDYANALEVMEKARECVAKYLGSDNIQYQRLSENIKIINDKVREAENEKAAAAEAENVDEAKNPEGLLDPEVPAAETIENGGEQQDSEAPYTETQADASGLNDTVQPQESDAMINDMIAGADMGDKQQEADSVTIQDDRESAAEDAETSAIESSMPEMTGLELCRRYYEEYGKPMIAEKFQAYESAIAVGLVGKGSDCFGYDDIQSRDHDFGPRFIMWVSKKVYSEIGEELQAAYEKLPRRYMGVDRIETFHGRDRSGVMLIEDFYKNILGNDLIGALMQNSGNDLLDKESLATIKSWLAVHDYALAAAVNGEVFRDDEGVFTRYRNKLKAYYPKAVWYRKIAQTCALFSQSGQYNLPRMRRRGQLVAAELARAECARQAMKLYYLLNKKYAPHDKWLFKAMPENPQMSVSDQDGNNVQVPELVEKMCLLPVDSAHEPELTIIIESLAVIFANELERQNMIGQCNLYLDASTKELTAKSDALLTAIVADTPVITALSLSIAKAEFEAFDKVQNEGGRASCQNNWPTFKIMRMSQYMTWTEDMLLQYLYEFKTSYEKGRNMIEEKYARMMESTAPDEYARFADKLPPISGDKKTVMEQIIGFQVKWMEEFAAAYPNLAGNARAIHTSEDLPYDTSYETYLRGELGTYSDRMLEMYGRYVVEFAQNGKNLTYEIMRNTVRFYGYKDLETANQHGNL